MDQLKLMFQLDEKALKGHLEKITKKQISLVITDNSSSMLSMKKKGRQVSLRIHRIFLSADMKVIDEIAGFVKNSRVRTPGIRDFIKQNVHRLTPKPPKRINIKTGGSNYDLLDIYSAINVGYFDGRVSCKITWGSKSPRRAAARRTLGSYCSDNNMIRINPLLDNKKVPGYFIEFIVYHEMLHADMGIETGRPGRKVHSKEFKRREKLFKHYDRAIAWEKRKW